MINATPLGLIDTSTKGKPQSAKEVPKKKEIIILFISNKISNLRYWKIILAKSRKLNVIASDAKIK